MGHLCNVPDIYWKSLPKEATPGGSPSHYINTEDLGLSAREVPLDFTTVSQTYAGKANRFEKDKTINSITEDVGTLWWRADQFVRLASEQKSILAEAKPPEDRKQEQDDKLPFNQGVYQLMVYSGLLGHFVGDASMPFHSSADHDGWHAGHGGIHFYYEDLVVGQFGADLQSRVFLRAQQLALKKPKFLKGTTLERMRMMSEIGMSEAPKALKLDPIVKKSEGKTPAVRKPAKDGLIAFQSMIVEGMARSSLLLATLWDEAYANAGAPDLSKYRSYRYPFTPDFVPLDYNAHEADKNRKAK